MLEVLASSSHAIVMNNFATVLVAVGAVHSVAATERRLTIVIFISHSK